MSLEVFLSSRYESEKFETFITKRFHGLDILDSSYTDDYLNESEKKHIQSYRYLGKAELDDNKEIGFFEFQSISPNIENKRVGYNAILKKLAYDEYLDGAIASFYHHDSGAWRLSFIGLDYDEGQATVTNLKRFTYVLGNKIPIKTPLSQLENLQHPRFDEIEKAFSVEAVTDEFYKSYKELFEDIIKELALQKELFIVNDDHDLDIEIRKFSRKLLGRITFLYFLQKKGWLGVKNGDKWGAGDKEFLQEISKNPNGNFYNDSLKPLFFTALNRVRDDDYFELFDCKIPFLNGGLFTRENYDKDEIILSNELFEKIFEVFGRYNFTIIEDLPHDSEVAIDPEMLGRVFENLIEDNYRKDKGAFYTPREIVHYMCKQSIIMYLNNDFEKESIKELVNDEITDNDYIKKNALAIKEKLIQMKVLDPAIGSGAFPMGILHEMVQIIGNLNKTENISNLKKEIIENSIYGVDIDGSAVDIAKLRFWLSIIVDEEEPFPLPNLDFKIMQGNSLLETVYDFDPLRKKDKNITISRIRHVENQTADDIIVLMQDKFKKYFNEHSSIKKKEIYSQIKNSVIKILSKSIEKFDSTPSLLEQTKKEKDEWEHNKKVRMLLKKIVNDYNYSGATQELFFYKIYFKEVIDNGGFDIVIGNPPYLRVQGIESEVSEKYKKLYKSATGSYDLYVLFVEKGLGLINSHGVLNFIMPHKWTNSAFGKGLREQVKEHIFKLISFDAYQVFNASTYTSLLWIKKESQDKCFYHQLDRDLNSNSELEHYLQKLDSEDFTELSNQNFSKDAWVLTDRQTYKILELLDRQPYRVKDIFEKIFTGLQTSKDSVYFLKNCYEEDDYIYGYSEELKKEVKVEKGLLKPLLKGDDVHRYETLSTNKYVVFPYRITLENTKEKPILYTEDELSKLFPMGYGYLKECENILRGREKGRLENDEHWYKYIYPKNLTLFDKEKLITPYLSYGSQLSYDSKGEYYGNTKCFGLIKKQSFEESYKFYLAILNSKLTWYFIQNTSSVMRGGYFTYTKDSLSSFPIPKIKNKEQSKPFEILVDYMFILKRVKEPIESSVSNKHIITSFDEVTDAMAYELYFKEEFRAKNIEFISYAMDDYKPINGLNIEDAKRIIFESFTTLKESNNKIRNNLILLDIEFKDLITPIKRSL